MAVVMDGDYDDDEDQTKTKTNTKTKTKTDDVMIRFMRMVIRSSSMHVPSHLLHRALIMLLASGNMVLMCRRLNPHRGFRHFPSMIDVGSPAQPHRCNAIVCVCQRRPSMSPSSGVAKHKCQF